MTPTLLAFLALMLFMVHEFEEIILVCPWIAKKKNDPKFANEIFVAGRVHYPSTETLAASILEEFILASLILLAGILFKLPELVLAITLGHTVHLLSHISQALRFRTWVPGSVTAVLTMPLLIYSIFLFCLNNPLHWLLLLVITPLIFAVIIANLVFLHRQADQVEKFLHS
ncbi:HXXEE domain-containing protein [Streptococcus tangpeifui]|uniref:HXXEE domain-containing protein n=1 Tax=Streptococcus tangpeifui TaxID=2709400 RepID=UPI0013EA7A5F|nr:HXXEE domain-containing protein [Streptococcus sp. ZJ1593]